MQTAPWSRRLTAVLLHAGCLWVVLGEVNDPTMVGGVSQEPEKHLPTIDTNLTAVPPSAFTYDPDNPYRAQGAPLFNPRTWPLRTWGRFIVDRNNDRVKWACINYHGAYMENHVVGGLGMWTLQDIANRIAELGFNCVRLPYSTQGVLQNPVINATAVSKNPEMVGMTMLEALDRTIEALGKAGLMVIINNHNSQSGWCCSADSEEGLWYTPKWTEEQWIEGLRVLAKRYNGVKHVVGFDLRNEPHDYEDVDLKWGSGTDKEDWAAASQRAGNVVLAENENVLIIVEGLCFAKELRPIRKHSIELDVERRLVYSVHVYEFFQLFSAFSQNVTAWKTLREYAVEGVFVGIVMMIIMVQVWRKLGSARPPKWMVSVTVGAWSSLACIGLVGWSVAAFRNLQGIAACDYVAWSDVLPKMIMYTVLMVLTMAATSFCFWKYWRNESEDDDDEAISEDEDGFEPLETDDDMKTLKVRPAWTYKYTAGLQVFSAILFFTLLFTGLVVLSVMFTSWAWYEHHMDGTWGFALENGHKYTAPVWVSEFGASARSAFWLMTMRYLSARDVDWAIWVLNPYKQVNKRLNGLTWEDVDPYWTDDSWGFLSPDFMKVRYPWMLNDLRQIMQSPSSWIPQDYACDRTLVSPECGG
eukprot:TRINITY_DN15976_c0_g1_i1.p1 TRINITY_DN15976_c0_g1~~TRINITY_DN15976_c0_g1_i1.p1  ORF type:complete len:641 (-),score=110.55 TRINITY_DN15976_c0_g1_i1:184-2106(-)